MANYWMILNVRTCSAEAQTGNLPHGFGATYANIFDKHEERLKHLRTELESKSPTDRNLKPRLKVATELVSKVEEDIQHFELVAGGLKTKDTKSWL